jgi:hypothetical protein
MKGIEGYVRMFPPKKWFDHYFIYVFKYIFIFIVNCYLDSMQAFDILI